MSSPVLDTTTRELSSLATRSIDDVRGLSDAELLELSRLDARVVKTAQTRAALTAGEIARRSDVALGKNGLAQRAGYRTPVELVKATTGATGQEASTAVRVGSLAQDDHPVSEALLSGGLSVAAADAIRKGLGTPSAEITEAVLTDAAATLCEEAPSLDADRLFQRARELRDEIDVAGVADRAAARLAKRSLTVNKLPDGMTLLRWTMDPETAAVVGDIYDRATSPRRGGPRFVDEKQAAQAASILDDTRTTDQLASDVFSELLRQGCDADSSQLLGSGAPVVRIVVTREALETHAGPAWIEGQSEPVSISTVERGICAGGIEQATFDHQRNPLDLGREQRLYSRRQRRMLAARDGGCRWPGCKRPPSWTEAHHVQPWAAQRGKTDMENGILLCRHHHLLLHNNGWEIQRRGDEYVLIPPVNIDAGRTPRPMPAQAPWLRWAG